MSKRRTLALFAAVAIASSAGGAAYYLWSRSVAEARAAVEALYGSRLADLKGGARGLGEWRGQVLVVNFWATWCAPCREEIPGFVRLQERYGERGVRFIGIAIDQPERVAQFATEFRINYPLLLGGLEAMELLRKAGNQAGVLPYTLVIDRGGGLVSRHAGIFQESRLEGLIQPLI